MKRLARNKQFTQKSPENVSMSANILQGKIDKMGVKSKS